jgi:hypothetical protein
MSHLSPARTKCSWKDLRPEEPKKPSGIFLLESVEVIRMVGPVFPDRRVPATYQLLAPDAKKALLSQRPSRGKKSTRSTSGIRERAGMVETINSSGAGGHGKRASLLTQTLGPDHVATSAMESPSIFRGQGKDK